MYGGSCGFYVKQAFCLRNEAQNYLDLLAETFREIVVFENESLEEETSNLPKKQARQEINEK